MRRALLVAMSIIHLGCSSLRPDPVREYARLAVALGERDPQSLDYYYGPVAWVKEVKAQPPPFPQIAKNARVLLAALVAEANKPGREMLIKQVRAVAVRAEQLAGKRLSFDEEASLLFDLSPVPKVDLRELETTRAEIARLLPGAGSLAARYEAFDRDWMVPADRLRAVMNAAVKECRDRSFALLDLPPEETLETEWVQDKPWSAYSLYQGGFHSRIQWNYDFGVTVDRALQLACHETYPGHHVHGLLTEKRLVQTGKNSELMIQPAFSPQSFLSEALASYAVDLVFTPEDRERFQRDILLPLAGLNASPGEALRAFRISRLVEKLEVAQVEIARDFLDGRLEFIRAGEALEQQALMAHTEATLKYMNQYRSYLLGYTVGKSMVQSCFAKAGEDRAAKSHVLRQLLLHEISLQVCGSEQKL